MAIGSLPIAQPADIAAAYDSDDLDDILGEPTIPAPEKSILQQVPRPAAAKPKVTEIAATLAGPTVQDEPYTSADTEFHLLASLVNNSEAFDENSSRIHEGLFYYTDAMYIFQSIKALVNKNKRVTIPTLREQLRMDDHTDVNFERFQDITLNYGHQSEYIPEFISTLEGLRKQREALVVVNTLKNTLETKTRPEKVADLVSTAVESLEGIMINGADGQSTIHALPHYLSQAVQNIDDNYHREGEMVGLSTGLRDLDLATGGLMPGDLLTIGARPGMGKTALALGIAAHVGRENRDAPVVYFSGEMGGVQLSMRILASSGSINASRIRTGDLEDGDWPNLSRACEENQESQLYIDEDSAITLTKIRARLRKLFRKHGKIGLIVIDYLGLMHYDGKSRGNRVEQLSEITRGLKEMARYFGCTVMLLSQLNRDLEKRPNKRPIPADLRESGSIEQDSDLIVFVYRDEVYNPDSPDKGTAEIIIAKNRSGPTDTVRVEYQSQFVRFIDYTGAPAY
jgi:replicative DNA helicase